MNEENEREKRVEGVNSVEQKVDKIRKDEVRKALKRMKSGKAVGPDDIPVEVWKCLGEAAVEFLTSLFNRVLESERMPEEWRRSVLVPIFKNKGDVQSCSNYRGIKLMSHTMKLWERVVEARLRKVVEIFEQQYGFMPRKSTTDAIFALMILMEKYRDGQRELHCVFVDLEKAYDRVPREELWYCMRKSGVAEKYVRVVQDMYERSTTVVRCAVGQTEEFKVEVGLHQGSALSPFLFAIVMDQLSEEVRQESLWTMMFADDIVICSESREQVEENLERWRFALERRGMKVSRSKTEYMCVNEREGSGTVRLQGEEVKKVQEFKYLGSTVQSNGESGKEVKKRVQAGWNGWRKVSGVLCDRKIPARIKGKVYRTVVRPAMLYGLETVSLRKRQEPELEVAELKMLSLVSPLQFMAAGLFETMWQVKFYNHNKRDHCQWGNSFHSIEYECKPNESHSLMLISKETFLAIVKAARSYLRFSHGVAAAKAIGRDSFCFFSLSLLWQSKTNICLDKKRLFEFIFCSHLLLPVFEAEFCLPSNKMGNEASYPLEMCSHFDADEIKRLGKRFKKLDLDNSGSLSVEEFMSLPELQQNPLVQRVIDIFDTDGNGEVDFKEFIEGVSQFSVKGDKEQKLRFAFRIYDMDKDGYISNGELFQVLKMMVGNNLKDTQLQQIVDKTIINADKDGDGRISFEEFCASMSCTVGGGSESHALY
ncbi:hypothetical protein QTP70_032634 [Hemibagrus guttatus]|uniref:ribonuclease H n=1 Tax=Hemibagrus guttatus TaxID=175788 RepID=A0AAE0VBQ2_9TELE|nr:hypothetical protein QTP70_032634 [Hemibagrus guttatus]